MSDIKQKKLEISIFWFRRDLRLEDNAGLYHALKQAKNVLPMFVFDRDILDDLADKSDARVQFIHDCISRLSEQLATEYHSAISVYYGRPLEAFKSLMEQYDIRGVYTNRDYEPYAKQRDSEVKELLAAHQILFSDYKDHVIFERDEVVKAPDAPYSIFTPYSKKWLARAESDTFYFKAYPVEKYGTNFLKTDSLPIPSLEDMGFNSSRIVIPPSEFQEALIHHYDKTRDYPGQEGTSRLGVHLRFGTVSIRALARRAQALNAVFLKELIWRDFYAMLLDFHPRIVHESCRPEFDRIQWRNDSQEFELWKQGMTGYPLVDAGMRQLNTTGYMHNRIRMVVASFLCKHLLIDWRWGEAYFAQKLLDYDLASNNGGWQWAAGTGCDAAPYFRVFNPQAQAEKFDKSESYIRAWVPEYSTQTYPKPMVPHGFARDRALAIYKEGLKRLS